MATIHIVPVADLIEHDTDTDSDDCICGPDTEFVDGGGWMIVHHSLDGREQDE